ncbi:hypothetical protein GCM10010393_59980 [Streptomyces gobitricini]|uniref:Uncharacterized protein n=1 Tax=Streptomyces gobitricini TaxID=68211 RepID=A0ABP6AMX1_9ACTN
MLGGPVVPQRESAEATLLMRELTSRDVGHARTSKSARVRLFAPLRRLRRSLFGNHA